MVAGQGRAAIKQECRVAELRQELLLYGLSKKGRKTDLIARLKDHFAQEVPEVVLRCKEIIPAVLESMDSERVSYRNVREELETRLGLDSDALANFSSYLKPMVNELYRSGRSMENRGRRKSELLSHYKWASDDKPIATGHEERAQLLSELKRLKWSMRKMKKTGDSRLEEAGRIQAIL